jgi:hypothetical protein
MMARTNRSNACWRIVLLVPVVVAGAMSLVGWRATFAHGGWPAITAMLSALVVVLGAVYATVLPMAGKMRQAASLDRLKLAFQAGGLRFMITVAAAVAVAMSDLVACRPFLIWIGLYYVVTTLAETVALTRWMQETGS